MNPVSIVHRTFRLACVVAVALHFLPTQAHAGDNDCAGERIMQTDVVSIMNGAEKPGVPEFTAVRGKFTYHFADAANLAAFKENPEKYEIQFGGACARMGPLSGDGRADLFAVHDHHLYLFASPQCRKTFLLMPEKFMDPSEPLPPQADEAAARRGRALIDRAVETIGGAARLDAIVTYRELTKRTETIGKDESKKSIEASSAMTLRFPDGVRQEEQWDTYEWSYVALASDGWSTDKEGTTPLVRQQYDSLLRDGRRNVLMILRARNQPGFVAVAGGIEKVQPPDGPEMTVDLVTVGFDGTRTTLGIDQATGMIVSETYRGRGPGLFFGEVRKVFSNFRPVGGLKLPFRVTIRFDGEEALTATTEFEVRIDEPVDATKFQRTKPPAKS